MHKAVSAFVTGQSAQLAVVVTFVLVTTIRNVRSRTGASGVEALGRGRGTGCSVAWDGELVEEAPSRHGGSDGASVASDEGVMRPSTHVVPPGAFVPGLEVVERNGVLGHSDILLDGRIKTLAERHDVDGCIGCSGEVDELLEVVNVLVDRLPALVVTS